MCVTQARDTSVCECGRRNLTYKRRSLLEASCLHCGVWEPSFEGRQVTQSFYSIPFLCLFTFLRVSVCIQTSILCSTAACVRISVYIQVIQASVR